VGGGTYGGGGGSGIVVAVLVAEAGVSAGTSGAGTGTGASVGEEGEYGEGLSAGRDVDVMSSFSVARVKKKRHMRV
jgi:hypothetical protein